MEKKRETILEWYQRTLKFIDAPCGGRGECGRCKIRFLSDAPEVNAKEKVLLSEEELAQGIRLACETEKTEQDDFILVGDIFSEGNHEVLFEPMEKMCEQQGIEIGDEMEFGIALDIGTTTLAMRLVGLRTKKHFATITAMNHQRAYGADVISRIQAANQGKLIELQKCIQQDVFSMLVKLITDAGISSAQVTKIAIAGNTTMCHLLLGYSCEGLGQEPFEPVDISLMKIPSLKLFEMVEISVVEQDFLTALTAEVVIMPGISAFIGADIVAGIYACDMDLEDEPYMLLDVGTNGEMVVGDKKGFIATSTAAGPVFEGGNISCGMPAVRGAISHVTEGECEIVGDVKPQGICGSGLVDLIAYLLKNGIIDKNGTLCEEYFETGFSIDKLLEKAVPKLRLTQADIRELQMGKAAIRAGMDLLMHKCRPERIYLAGGFGAAIDVESACYIDMFPNESAVQICAVGNAALEGVHKFLLDEQGEERVTFIAENVRELRLAKEGNFEEKYIHFMQFLI